MNKEQFLPITVDEVYNNDISELIVEGTMIRDFGPWTKGTKHALTFDFDHGTVEEYNEEGKLLFSKFLTLGVI